MKKFDFDWQTPDQLKLIGTCWLPEGELRAVVCMVHGFAEHIGRYEHVAGFLCANGIALMGYDQRGHGRSEGKRGHTPVYEDLLDGVRELLALASEKFEGIPLFLYGHSMGGNIVANFVIRKQPEYLHGAIIASPWLRLSVNPSGFKLMLAKAMNAIFPAYTEKHQVDAAGLSHDPEVVRAYRNDPLIHHSITARLFVGVTTAGLYALLRADRVNLPLLLMHGTGDPITSAGATEHFSGKVNADLLTYKTWKGKKHELHNETNKQEVLQTVLDWINLQLEKRKAGEKVEEMG